MEDALSHGGTLSGLRVTRNGRSGRPSKPLMNSYVGSYRRINSAFVGLELLDCGWGVGGLVSWSVAEHEYT